MSPIPLAKYHLNSENYKVAAVVAILYQKDGEWTISYMERTSKHKGDKHAGQISFPGGKKEDNETILACALRETNEEFGIASTDLQIIGQLKELYVFVSNFLVFPFVAYAEEIPKFVLEKEEVESLIEVPLSHLLDYRNRKIKDIHIGTRILKDVPYFDLYGKVLWGATAMITENLLQIIGKIKAESP